MKFIYKITNDINDKIYIGKTSFNIKKRFKEHYIDSLKKKYEKRPLYSEMKKYGINHFYIELIEECEDIVGSQRESYWIEFYQTRLNGYNITLGGDGKPIYNHQEILLALQEHPYLKDISKQFGCSVSIVHKIAEQNNIKLKYRYKSKAVIQMDKNGKEIQKFTSLSLAVKWCFEHGYCLNSSNGAKGHISDCANGKRKSAYGYKWKFTP